VRRYRTKPNTNADAFATKSTPKPADAPGSHDTTRPTSGKRGKKRNPSDATPPYPARAMSRYHAASAPSSPVCVSIGIAKCRVVMTWRIVNSEPTTTTRDMT